MKTLGRVLIILIAFAIVMGMTYFAVNAGGSSTTTTSVFENGSANFAPIGARPELRSENSGGADWMFGLLKNIIVVGIIVAIIVFPKNLTQQRRRAVSIRIK
jgi:hypothetical protein